MEVRSVKYDTKKTRQLQGNKDSNISSWTYLTSSLIFIRTFFDVSILFESMKNKLMAYFILAGKLFFSECLS